MGLTTLLTGIPSEAIFSTITMGLTWFMKRNRRTMSNEEREHDLSKMALRIQEMKDAKVDLQLVVYSGAVHGFTHKNTDRHQADADRRSWIAMKNFFDEIF